MCASFRPYVCLYVRYSEISESVHRNFLKFGTKLVLPNATEVTFSEKSCLAHFGPIQVQKCPFRPKNDISANFQETSHKIFLILHILGLIYEITKRMFWEKSGSGHFGPSLIQICPFLAQNQHFSLDLPNSLLNFAEFWYKNLSYGLLLGN